MSWKSIVAGVDTSPQGIRAAIVAARMGETARTTCYLAHAVRDPFTDATLAQVPLDLSDIGRLVRDAASIRIRGELRDHVPAGLLDRLDVRLGAPGWVLNDVVNDRNAGLLVLGGKHHSTLGRWIGGSTALQLARTVEVPMLVTGDTLGGFRRILVAVDLSSGARLALEAAQRFADLFDARLRVLHVVEPLPLLPELPTVLTDERVMQESERELERTVWPLIDRDGVDRMVRRGQAAEVITAAADEWCADLVVVASHGRGWVDRMLIGSVTEKLLNRLPTSVLVIPMTAATARRPQDRRPAASPLAVH